MIPQDSALILTKIIATLGPASIDASTVTHLIDHGARVFRINFSHGSFPQFAHMVNLVRRVQKATGATNVPVGLLGDLCGPKIRLGPVCDDGLDLHVGDEIRFQKQRIVAGTTAPDNIAAFSTTHPALIDEVCPGDRLLIDDGAVRVLVVEKSGAADQQNLICRVTTGGRVSSAKGINLPDTSLHLDSITEYDWQCLDWAIEHDLDFLALSFIRCAEEVRRLKDAVLKRGRSIPVIAKIEKPQALDHLESIIRTADAVMVARGDLGVEMDLAEVPLIQKQIIQMAHGYGKPVIVATQMLQSMVERPTPTRAEVSDVANAILDGADAVMLSGETAIGGYPVQSVRMMARIAKKTQSHLTQATATTRTDCLPKHLTGSQYRTAALAHGVGTIVRDIRAKLVATWSQHGGGALYLSQNRLHVPILAASSDPAALRRMSLMYAVQPVLLTRPKDTLAFAAAIEKLILDQDLAEAGDPYVLVSGEPIGISGVTNRLSIRYVGDVCKIGSK